MEETLMSIKRLVTMLAVALIFIGGYRFANASVNQDEQATVTVTLSDMGLEFGAVGPWEAALYSGPVEGEETLGGFTDWKEVGEDDQVVFNLPEDILDEMEAPWGEMNGTYVRIRTIFPNQVVGVPIEYVPAFDMVSDPFTLNDEGDYHVEFSIDSSYEETGPNGGEVDGIVQEGSIITVRLIDLGGEFGALDSWAAALFTGANPGEEASDPFTDWKVAMDGVVEFTLPDDVMEEATAPWDEEIYVRVRSLQPFILGNGIYPAFDLVGRPFILTQGIDVESTITVERGLVEEEEYIQYLPIIKHDFIVAPNPGNGEE
jgi:hypothetical protein